MEDNIYSVEKVAELIEAMFDVMKSKDCSLLEAYRACLIAELTIKASLISEFDKSSLKTLLDKFKQEAEIEVNKQLKEQ